jgi:CheY-like chemotaxis protein
MAGTVLCVDNDRNLCQILAKALMAEGYEVASEYDGQRALSLIEEDPPDLVLLDLLLPRRDGFSVLEAIRAMDGPVSRTPVVLLTGCSPTPEYTRRAEALEASALLTKPVPLDRLVAVVAQQLGEPKRPIPVEPRPRRARERERSNLSGALEHFPFPALLHHLHGLRATGVLHIGSDRRRKWVQLRDGYPVAVRSNLLNETLGNFLARSGRVSSQVMEESRRRMRPGQLQGEILVAMEVLSEDDVSEVLREQAEEKLFELFAWHEGVFSFEFDARLQKASGLARVSPANLILRGVCSRSRLEVVDGYLRAQRSCLVIRGESPFYRFQEIDLDPEQRSWFEALNGTQRVEEFLDAPEPLRRTLYALAATGLVELVGDEGISVRPTPARIPTPARAQPGPEDEARRDELADLAARFARQNLFEILGVHEEETSEGVIRAAYEGLAERTHPDRVSSSSEAVRRLAEEAYRHVEQAYATLSDPRRRQEYILDRRRADREAAKRDANRRALEAQQEFRKGEEALQQRDYELALRLFGRSLELYPEDGEYHSHYAWALHLCYPDSVDIVEEALEHAKRGLKLAGDREKPYLLLGRLCKATGRAGAAEKMFTRAVQIQPNCVEALRELRLINMRRHREKGFIGRLLRR